MKKYLFNIIFAFCMFASSIANSENTSLQPLSDPDHKFDLIPASDTGAQRRIDRQKFFLERQARDRVSYTEAILKEIEDLYQVANVSKFSNDAAANLEKLVTKTKTTMIKEVKKKLCFFT